MTVVLYIVHLQALLHCWESYGRPSDTTIHAIIPRPLLRLQVMESLNRDLVAIQFGCLKWIIRLNLKKLSRWRLADLGIYSQQWRNHS